MKALGNANTLRSGLPCLQHCFTSKQKHMPAFRILETCTNTAKALQLRLEDHGNLFWIVLEGMEVYIGSGTTVPAENDEPYMVVESQVSRTYIAKDWYEARSTFNHWKQHVMG